MTAEQRKELEELADVTVNGSWFFGQLAARLAKGIQSLLAQLNEAERERDEAQAREAVLVGAILRPHRDSKGWHTCSLCKCDIAPVGHKDADEFRHYPPCHLASLPAHATAHLEHVRKLEANQRPARKPYERDEVADAYDEGFI